MTFAQALRQQIAQLGLTQAQAAESIGVTQTRISSWMRNGRPDPKSYVSIMRFLDASPVEFGTMIVLTEMITAAREAADLRISDPNLRLLGDLVEGRIEAPSAWPSWPLSEILDGREERGV